MSEDIVPVDQELWMRDSDTKTCFSCDAVFTIFRRRHHCRYCGYVFCSKCTPKHNEVLNGKKMQRICIKCYNNLVKKRIQVNQPSSIIAESGCSTPSSIHDKNAMFTKTESQSSVDDEPTRNRIFTASTDIFHDTEMLRGEINNNDGWEEICVEYLRERTLSLLQDQGINNKWSSIIIQLVQNCVGSLCSSVQFRGDAMNINKYLRIQSVILNDSYLSCYICSVAFVKNLAHKKMPKNIRNPKILLINQISEGTSAQKTLISMDKLIDQEGSLSEITLKKILSIKPSLIVCSQGLPQAFVTELSKNNITALINVKKKTMSLLARATLGKVLDSTDEIHHERNFMGECNSFYQDSQGSSVLVNFAGLPDPSLAGTIFIYGPDSFELASIKKIIRSLVVEYRNIRLERTVFTVYAKKCIQNVFFELNDDMIVFKHLVVSDNKMCLKPEICAVNFYSEKDIALGEFIITASEKIEQRCKNCSSSWGAHSLYYIKKSSRIKITFYKSNIEHKTQDIYFNRECRICGKLDQTPDILYRTLWEYSFYKFINNFFKINSISSESKRCKHDFYKHSKFCFFIKEIKIIIQYEDNPCYTIIQTEFKEEEDKEAYYSRDLIEKNLKELKYNAKKLIEAMMNNFNETCLKISKDHLEENRKNNDPAWETFFIEIEKNILKLQSRLKKLEMIKDTKYENFLRLEKTRRKIFLELCEIQTSFLNSCPSKKGRKREKHFLGDTISSSGDSSGDTKKSPSPNHSFITEDDRESFARSIKFPSNFRLAEKPSRQADLYLKNEFTTLQRGNLTLPLGHDNYCIPVEETDLLSIIAYSLNTQEYYDEVLSSLPSNQNIDKIEAELLSSSEKHFQHQFTTYETEKFRELSHKEESVYLYGNHITFNVHMFFPRQFQIIRNQIIPNHTNFIMGIVSSENKKEQLGKSSATFSTSQNNKFIIKILDEKEFGMFKDLAPNYFRHYCNSKFHNMPCLMVRTLGCYRVYTKNHTQGKSKCEWAILYENLGAAMPKDFQIYDLKGSFNHRRYINAKEKRTKMDKNFLEDFGGLPLTLSKSSKKVLDMSIWNDTLFLSKQNIIDYSLLLIVSNNYKVLTLGIIDYIAKYTFEKALEHKYKKAVGTDNPTITRPTLYKNRFRDSMANTFFIEYQD
jgi:Phosphatidylinositol-4-phosphate 5-Kinase/TCP-1/cpn60 chaperonin family/FYVE zinc finger